MSEETAKPGPKPKPIVDMTVPAIVVGRDKVPVPIEEVEHMASLGCPDREIATYFGINEDTLRYNFKPFLTKGRQQLKTSLRQAQIRLALDGNAVMLIWLGKNLLQQNDSGTTSEEARPLPWSDDIDEATIEDIEDLEDADTEE